MHGPIEPNKFRLYQYFVLLYADRIENLQVPKAYLKLATAFTALTDSSSITLSTPFCRGLVGSPPHLNIDIGGASFMRLPVYHMLNRKVAIGSNSAKPLLRNSR